MCKISPQPVTPPGYALCTLLNVNIPDFFKKLLTSNSTQNMWTTRIFVYKQLLYKQVSTGQAKKLSNFQYWIEDC